MPVQLGPLPVDVGYTYPSAEEARKATRAPLELVECKRCRVIRNLAFEPSHVAFYDGYDVSLDRSPTYRRHVDQLLGTLVRRLSRRINGTAKVLEIGCGNGAFLRELAKRVSIDAVGVDPTLPRSTQEDIKSATTSSHLQFLSARFDERVVREPRDLIICRSVLEDIPDPYSLLLAARRRLRNDEAEFYIEVFNGVQAFARDEIWSVHFEQGNYFAESSLRWLLNRARLGIHELQSCFDGQHLSLLARFVEEPRNGDGISDGPRTLSGFAKKWSEAISSWSSRAVDWVRSGETIVVWGTGGKGISFLNAVDPSARCITAAVDINPHRAGRFVPGSGHPIVSPESLRHGVPQRVLVSNPVYLDEITQQLRDLRIYPRIETI